MEGGGVLGGGAKAAAAVSEPDKAAARRARGGDAGDGPAARLGLGPVGRGAKFFFKRSAEKFVEK